MSVQEKVSKRVMQGVVVSDKMDKTIVVRIDRKVKHPIYKKIINRSSKVKAHDANNVCKEGDIVLVKETKPISKDKSWELIKVVEDASGEKK